MEVHRKLNAPDFAIDIDCSILSGWQDLVTLPVSDSATVHAVIEALLRILSSAEPPENFALELLTGRVVQQVLKRYESVVAAKEDVADSSFRLVRAPEGEILVMMMLLLLFVVVCLFVCC